MTTTDNDNINPTQIEPVTIKLTDTDLAAIRAAAEFTPVFSAWQTLTFLGVAGETQPQPLLPADLKRRRAYIQVRGTVGTPVQAEGSVTSPGANVAIANVAIASLAPGWYTVNWAVELDGTPGAGDVDNFILKGPGLGAGFTSSNDGAIGRYPQVPAQIYIPAGNATALSIRSILAGTAGAIYTAHSALWIAGDGVTALNVTLCVERDQGE